MLFDDFDIFRHETLLEHTKRVIYYFSLVSYIKVKLLPVCKTTLRNEN
jgi:hypothetical protein